jgi:hypothetical protein
MVSLPVLFCDVVDIILQLEKRAKKTIQATEHLKTANQKTKSSLINFFSLFGKVPAIVDNHLAVFLLMFLQAYQAPHLYKTLVRANFQRYRKDREVVLRLLLLDIWQHGKSRFGKCRRHKC